MTPRRTTRVAALATTLVLAGAGAASAEPGSATRDGRTLTVSKAEGLRVEGERVRVRGSGYDRGKGIYVAFCVDNGPGRVPTPCGGGADTEGTSGNSVWISDLPPAYGTGLAKPYGQGGTFDVEIHVKALLRPDDPETAEDETVDCRVARCAVVTRNDHTRSEDRSQDVVVPVRFGAPVSTPPAQQAPPAAAPSTAAVTAAPAQGSAGEAGRASGPAAAPLTSAVPAPTSAAPTASAPPTPAALAAPVTPTSEPAPDGRDLVTEDEDVRALGAGTAADGGTGTPELLVAAAGLSALVGGALAWHRRRVGRGAPGRA